jgi:hypothetical protein
MLSLAFSLTDSTLGFTVAPLPATSRVNNAQLTAARTADIEMAVSKLSQSGPHLRTAGCSTATNAALQRKNGCARGDREDK